MNNASTRPGSPLSNRFWRLGHSAWLLAVIFGFGLFSFVGYLYCAIRIQTRKWWARAAVMSGLTAICWVLMTVFVEASEDGSGSATSANQQGPGDDIAIAAVLVTWIGMVVYGFVVNREYLRWRAERSESNAWYNQPVGVSHSTNLAPAPDKQLHQPAPTGHALSLGNDYGRYFAPASPTTRSAPPPATSPSPTSTPDSLVDVNSAAAQAIAANLGLDATTSARIVSVRDQRRGFQDMDDLVAAAGLRPHELVRIRKKVTFGSYNPASPAGSASVLELREPSPDSRRGRILDY